MRIVCLSDTHGHHHKAKVPDGDVFVFAGDLMNTGTKVKELTSFNKWLGTLPHKNKIVVAGNHDRLFETNPPLAQALLTNATYLQDSGVEIAGVKFWGSPWQPEYMNWAFNLPRGGEELKRRWDEIPQDTDVLITHTPPYGCLDVEHAQSLGCELLRDRMITAPSLKLHVFGHIHDGSGIVNTDTTTYVNASFLNSRYQPWRSYTVPVVDL